MKNWKFNKYWNLNKNKKFNKIRNLTKSEIYQKLKFISKIRNFYQKLEIFIENLKFLSKFLAIFIHSKGRFFHYKKNNMCVLWCNFTFQFDFWGQQSFLSNFSFRPIRNPKNFRVFIWKNQKNYLREISYKMAILIFSDF